MQESPGRSEEDLVWLITVESVCMYVEVTANTSNTATTSSTISKYGRAEGEGGMEGGE